MLELKLRDLEHQNVQILPLVSRVEFQVRLEGRVRVEVQVEVRQVFGQTLVLHVGAQLVLPAPPHLPAESDLQELFFLLVLSFLALELALEVESCRLGKLEFESLV